MFLLQPTKDLVWEACIAEISDNVPRKRLTRKQMPQRLLIAPSQVKLGNGTEILLIKIRQIIYSLYQAEEISNKVYKDVMNLTKAFHKMNTILMNSGNSETSDSHKLLLKLSVKINLKRRD